MCGTADGSDTLDFFQFFNDRLAWYYVIVDRVSMRKTNRSYGNSRSAIALDEIDILARKLHRLVVDIDQDGFGLRSEQNGKMVDECFVHKSI